MNSDSIEKRCSLPFAVEYAKSGRSTCKMCKACIANGTLRVSAREPSTFFDGLQDNWFHFSCFWKKIKPGKDDINESSIRGVDWLKWEDQELLRKHIKAFYEKPNPADISTTGRPSSSGGYQKNLLVMQNLRIEPSATNRGKCQGCALNFKVREMKCQYRSKFLHPACLFKAYTVIEGTLDLIIGWELHAPDDKQPVVKAYDERMKELLLKRQQEERKKSSPVTVESTPTPDSVICLSDTPSPPAVVTISPEEPAKPVVENVLKRVAETEVGSLKVEEPEDEGKKKRRLAMEERRANKKKEKLKRQADKMWDLRQVFERMTDYERRDVLTLNDQDIPSGNDAGPDGRKDYCNTQVGCCYSSLFSHRDPAKIRPRGARSYCRICQRKIIERLVDCALYGKPAPCPQCSNGRIFYSSSYKTYVCTGYATEYAKCMYESKNPLRTPFSISNSLIRNYSLQNAEFNSMVDRLYNEEEEIVKPDGSSSFKYLGARRLKINSDYADEAFDGNMKVVSGINCPSSSSGVSRQIIKKGTVVDSEFPYAECCHVYKDEEGGLYSATMTFTDLACNKNSYYKVQLLAHDSKPNVFYTFRSWGRVGTNVGDTLTNQMDQESGIREFCRIFKEKTNNEWKYRKFFRKFPGFFSYCETDYSEFEELGNQEVVPGSKTLLPKPVKEIIMSIFNVENMKLAMQSFEMDLNKLPLGKLSKNQIMSAYSVLTQLQDLLANEETMRNGIQLLDATNKFYTIIPHNFGMKAPEPIDSFKKIKEKSDMLDMLLDIQFAYDQIKSDSAMRLSNVDPVDSNYEKLKCKMEPLNSTSMEYKMIFEYMKNTHGSTHLMEYDLIDIIKVERFGEASKFKKNLGNRMLLWHGSGKMNYAGILGQGLRIAPPEAPVTGYMFGKGVYFADMFTKSSFYCKANCNEEAYMLLSDVALGNPCELLQSNSNMCKAKLPKGTHSVKGLGRERPEVTGNYMHPDGYMIPKGKATIQMHGQQGVNFWLLYNEYIVYDTDQIELKYLIRMRVKRANHI